MKTSKKSFLVFFGILFIASGLFFPMKTVRAGSVGDFVVSSLGGFVDPVLNGIVDYNSCYVNWVFGCDDNIASNPTTTATPINGACGNTSSASGINTCSSGTLGENHAQSGGIYDWYCMGINGGSNSGLCRYTPAATTTTTTTTNTTNTTSSNCNSHNCSHSLTNAEATCYRNANSDLQSSYSAASFSGLRQHWSTFGCKEGRNYCCPICGDGSCNSSSEDCSNCPQDCGNCPPSCSSAPGECGSARGGTFCAPPADNLCEDGSHPPVSESGQHYSWSCLGSCGGDPASCATAAPPGCVASPGNCSVSCGGGSKVVQHCTACEGGVLKEYNVTVTCNTQPCPPGYREVTPW